MGVGVVGWWGEWVGRRVGGSGVVGVVGEDGGGCLVVGVNAHEARPGNLTLDPSALMNSFVGLTFYSSDFFSRHHYSYFGAAIFFSIPGTLLTLLLDAAVGKLSSRSARGGGWWR